MVYNTDDDGDDYDDHELQMWQRLCSLPSHQLLLSTWSRLNNLSRPREILHFQRCLYLSTYLPIYLSIYLSNLI